MCIWCTVFHNSLHYFILFLSFSGMLIKSQHWQCICDCPYDSSCLLHQPFFLDDTQKQWNPIKTSLKMTDYTSYCYQSSVEENRMVYWSVMASPTKCTCCSWYACRCGQCCRFNGWSRNDWKDLKMTMKNRNFLIELFEYHWLYKEKSESIESHSVDEWKQLMCKHRKPLYDCDTLFVCVFSNICYSHDFYNVLRRSVLRQTDWFRRVSDSWRWTSV